jgi:hypothetical protein
METTTVFDAVVPPGSRDDAAAMLEVFNGQYGRTLEALRCDIERVLLAGDGDHLKLMGLALRSMLGQFEQLRERNKDGR